MQPPSLRLVARSLALPLKSGQLDAVPAQSIHTFCFFHCFYLDGLETLEEVWARRIKAF
jgi:hypothetical protein